MAVTLKLVTKNRIITCSLKAKFDAEMIESGLLKREEVKSRTHKTNQHNQLCWLANLPNQQQQKTCDFVILT